MNNSSVNNNWKKIFALIYTGQAFSVIGSSAAQFAIIWYLTIKTQSAVVLTIASVVGFLPQGLISPFAGVWVDRYNRKTVMMLSDGFVALCGGILGVSFLFGEPSVWFIYVILFLRAMGSTFHAPAMTAAIPSLVPEEYLVKSGGWGQAVTSGSNMLGPVIGSFMMSIATVPIVMLVDILGAMLAILTLASVKVPNVERTNKDNRFFDDLKEGIFALLNNKALISMGIPMLIASVLCMPLSSLLPLLVNKYFGGGEIATGISRFLYSGGYVVGALALGIFGKGEKQFKMISISLVILGVAATCGGILPKEGFGIFLFLIFAFGVAATCYLVPYTAYIQKNLNPGVIGKVMSLLMSIMSLAVPVGLAFAGPLADAIGINTWYFVSGVLIIITGLWTVAIARKYE